MERSLLFDAIWICLETPYDVMLFSRGSEDQTLHKVCIKMGMDRILLQRGGVSCRKNGLLVRCPWISRIILRILRWLLCFADSSNGGDVQMRLPSLSLFCFARLSAGDKLGMQGVSSSSGD